MSWKILETNMEKGTMIVEFEKDGKLVKANVLIPCVAGPMTPAPGTQEFEEYLEIMDPFDEERAQERSGFNRPPTIVDIDDM